MRWGALLGIFLALSFPSSVTYAAATVDPIDQGVTVSAEVPLRYGSVLMRGQAVPNALISFYRNGILIGTTESDQAGYFGKVLTGLPQSKQTIDIAVVDSFGRVSGTTTVNPVVLSLQQTKQEGIILSPTMSKTQLVKRFLYQKISGGSTPNTQLVIIVDGKLISTSTVTDSRGEWSIDLDPYTTIAEHKVEAVARTSGGSESGITAGKILVTPNADINQDGVVDMVDLSLLMQDYTYAVDPTRYDDITGEGAINGLDLSIMYEQWTGL